MIRPDTELLTDTGRTPVTDYQSGDEALASDPTTGRAAPKPIAAVESVVPESEAVHIRVRRGDGRVCSTHRQGLHTAEGDRQRPLRAGNVDADRICRFVIDTTDRLPPDAQVTRTTPEWAPCYRLAVVDPPRVLTGYDGRSSRSRRAWWHHELTTGTGRHGIRPRSAVDRPSQREHEQCDQKSAEKSLDLRDQSDG